MQTAKKDRVIDVELDAFIRFQRSNDTIGCVIRNITSDYTDIMAVASDSRVCMREDVDIDIPEPDNDQVINCTGRIIWHLENDDLSAKQEKYLIRIFIAEINQTNQRRLDHLIAQKNSIIGDLHNASFIL